MRKKVCHVASNVNNSLLLEAVAKCLDPTKFEFSAVFLHPEYPEIATSIKNLGFETSWIKYRSKKDLPKAIYKLAKIFRGSAIDIVHTHLVDASVAGLTAAALSRIKNRLHTRHHGSECHNYYPHGVYYDRYVNFLSTQIVAITNSVRDVLIEKEQVDSTKISVINHGFDLSSFSSDDQTVQELRSKYNLNDRWPVVGVISRFVEWKGVQHIIPAFKQFAERYPNAKLVLANATGNYASAIDKELGSLDPDKYECIEFESKIFDLYRTFDQFVHVPIDRESEAFGQTYIESLFMGIPSVFTLSGVASDFIVDEVNALVVPYENSDAILTALERLISEHELTRSLSAKGITDVKERFGMQALALNYDRLYSGL